MSRDEYKTNEEALARRAKVKNPASKGMTVIDHRYCKGCGICIHACPTGALLFHEAVSSKWGVEVAVSSPEHCTGCRQCEMHCPDFAIFAYKKDESESRAV